MTPDPDPRVEALRFSDLRAANMARRKSFPISDDWTLNDWMTALAGEVGEAANILKKIRREDFALDDARDALSDELADVQVYLDQLALAAGIDLGASTVRKFNEVSVRVGSSVRLAAIDAIPRPELGDGVVTEEMLDRACKAYGLMVAASERARYRSRMALAISAAMSALDPRHRAAEPVAEDAVEAALDEFKGTPGWRSASWADDVRNDMSRAISAADRARGRSYSQWQTGEPLSLAQCPVGLFRFGDMLVLKTEYGNNEGRIDAYIVETGEFFWGDPPQTIKSQRAQIVYPVIPPTWATDARTATDESGPREPAHPAATRETPGTAVLAGGETNESEHSIATWADDTFGPATSNMRIAARANEEMSELLRALSVDDNNQKAAAEIADVVIILTRLARNLGTGIASEVCGKMEINRSRRWNKDNTGHGYHVRNKTVSASGDGSADRPGPDTQAEELAQPASSAAAAQPPLADTPETPATTYTPEKDALLKALSREYTTDKSAHDVRLKLYSAAFPAAAPTWPDGCVIHASKTACRFQCAHLLLDSNTTCPHKGRYEKNDGRIRSHAGRGEAGNG